MNIQKLPIAQLKAAKYNPRKDLQPNDEEYKKLKRSLETFGYVEPVIWNKQTGNVVGGHQRLKVLADLGHNEVDCVVVDIPEMKEKLLNVALNKISGEWDIPKLSDLMHGLVDLGEDVTFTGYDMAEVSELFKLEDDVSDVEDDFDAEEAAEEIINPISHRGDVWLLGKHRLMCGDSTSPDDIKTLMDGFQAKCVFTDPPWNVDYGAVEKGNAMGYKPRTILNDHMSTEQFGAFLLQAFTAMREASEPGCMTYVVMSAQEWGNLMNALAKLDYHWSSTIIWNKDHPVLSRKDYHTKYEPIWYGWLDGSPRLCPLTDRKQSDVWDIKRPTASPEHPTMKPVELVAKALTNSSYHGDTVLDIFGGSGTTLIAAEQTERVCRMMELSERYTDVIVKRFIALADGNDAEVRLLRDGVELDWHELQE
jgi:DNA modification methylase